MQVIEADSPERANVLMFKYYGRNWAFQYTEEQWQDSLDEGFFKNVRYLPEINVFI